MNYFALSRKINLDVKILVNDIYERSRKEIIQSVMEL